VHPDGLVVAADLDPAAMEENCFVLKSTTSPDEEPRE
jgi:hypothetical protein